MVAFSIAHQAISHEAVLSPKHEGVVRVRELLAQALAAQIEVPVLKTKDFLLGIFFRRENDPAHVRFMCGFVHLLLVAGTAPSA